MRDLGDGFSVRRALPHAKRQMIGPFIFFDQMGPVQLMAGKGMDVRPHPHIGLATVTYLFDGRVMHRDSEGNALEITPGSMNLMTAGRGISHSERTPASMRTAGAECSASRAGSRCRKTMRRWRRCSNTSMPRACRPLRMHGVRARVIAGSAFGQKSPVGMVSEWFYAEVLLDAGASAPLDADHEERAIYVAEGEVDIAGDKFAAPQLLVFRPGDRITVTATQPARLMFLGGAALEGPRYLWWNFVSSRKERIEEAKQEWKSGRFALIPGDEKEFIPLPEN